MGFMDRGLRGRSYGFLGMKCLASWAPGFRGLGLKEFDSKSSSSCKQVCKNTATHCEVCVYRSISEYVHGLVSVKMDAGKKH